MTHELIPPTEDFFSQQWFTYDAFGMKMVTDDLFSRIDSTRRKLSELESKLSQRLDTERYNPDLRSFLDRVGWLRGYIGVWRSRSNNDPLVLGRDVEMEYPYNKLVMSQWPENLFGERKEGNVLILLSPSVVHWLNAVDRRLSGVSSWNVPYSIL